MNYKKWKIVRRLTILCWIIFAYISYQAAIPDELYLLEGRTLSEQVDVPAAFIPEGKIRTHQAKDLNVIPAGTNIGIYLKNSGVLVVDQGTLEGQSGSESPCAYKLFAGDRILSVDDEKIDTKEQLVQRVSDSKGKAMCLGIVRNGERIDVKVNPVLCKDQSYRLGIWVRDDIAGIGTLTYITKDGSFGALGHGVSDMDSKELISMNQGQIYQTMLTGVKKGKKGSPGEISGVIAFSDQTRIGQIEKNSEIGIYGTVDEIPGELQEIKALQVGYKQEIEKGKASIISSVSGERRQYEIFIDDINYHPSEKNKGIRYHVVDEGLLEETGGIIQGMSGSPIIQNGKVIGAVTHVFVNDPTKGYGIFLETMLEEQ